MIFKIFISGCSFILLFCVLLFSAGLHRKLSRNTSSPVTHIASVEVEGNANYLMSQKVNYPAVQEIKGGSFYKFVTDSESGESAIISADQESVTLTGKDGNMIWSNKITAQIPHVPVELSPGALTNDIFRQIESKGMKAANEQKIQSAEFFNEALLLRVGKAYVSVDRKTGNMTSFEMR